MRPRAGGRWPCPPGTVNGRERVVEICSATAVRRRAGLPILPIRPSPASAGDPCGIGSMPPASMGAAARPPATLRPAGPALHRSWLRPAANRPLVRPALAGRGHLPGSARPSRRRDPAPLPARRRGPVPCGTGSTAWLSMVGPRHRTHHALPARPVLRRHALGRAARPPSAPGRRDRGLVPQDAPDLRRYPRRRASPHVG